MKDSLIRGRAGERCAARYLRDRGYEIIGANYHSRFGEIDIIAQKGRYIAFVEVKARANSSFAAPREAVDLSKQRRIRDTALMYLSRYKTELQPRFDVIEVILDGDGRALKINHIKSAFE